MLAQSAGVFVVARQTDGTARRSQPRSQAHRAHGGKRRNGVIEPGRLGTHHADGVARRTAGRTGCIDHRNGDAPRRQRSGRAGTRDASTDHQRAIGQRFSSTARQGVRTIRFGLEPRRGHRFQPLALGGKTGLSLNSASCCRQCATHLAGHAPTGQAGAWLTVRDHFGEHLRPPHGRVAVGREAVKEDAISAAFEGLQRRQHLVEDQRYGEPLRQHDAVKTLHRRRPAGQ